MFQPSEQQQAIFTNFATGEGNTLIRARAGTGKTTTVLQGLSYVPKGLKVLLAAFNKNIATELSERIAKIETSCQIEAKTLHALGFAFIRQNWQGVRVDSNRDEDMARKACGNSAPDSLVRKVAKLASLAKGAAPFGTQDELESLAWDFDLCDEGDSSAELAAFALQAMENAKVKDGRISFDDMVWLPVVHGWIRAWYDRVFVDECQDMNKTQILLALGSCKKTGRIAVIGDDRQAIYGFRGADSGSLDRLKEELNCTEFPLTLTYRCPSSVVSFIATNLVPDYSCPEGAHEGQILPATPQQLTEWAKAGDLIGSRKNAPLAPLCLRFLREGKKASIQGRDIGQKLISLCKKLAGKENSIPKFLEKLNRHQEKQAARISAANGKNMESRLQVLEDECETLAAIAQDMAGIKELISRIETLFTDEDPKKSNSIMLSSIHKAKGLEFNRVFALVDTLYPGGRVNQEEQNLEYVLKTRTKDTLFIVTGIG